jgi:hypothetical protein
MGRELVERIPPTIAAAAVKYRHKAALAPELGDHQHDVRVHGARGPPSPFPPVRLRPGDRIITAAEAAKIRGVSRETLRLMSESGLGPCRIQLSKRRFGYLASDFIEVKLENSSA